MGLELENSNKEKDTSSSLQHHNRDREDYEREEVGVLAMFDSPQSHQNFSHCGAIRGPPNGRVQPRNLNPPDNDAHISIAILPPAVAVRVGIKESSTTSVGGGTDDTVVVAAPAVVQQTGRRRRRRRRRATAMVSPSLWLSRRRRCPRRS